MSSKMRAGERRHAIHPGEFRFGHDFVSKLFDELFPISRNDLACRAVKGYVAALPSVIAAAVAAPTIPVGLRQRTTGRIFTAGSWRADHLIPIYQHCGDRIVDLCLDGKIAGRMPELVRAT